MATKKEAQIRELKKQRDVIEQQIDTLEFESKKRKGVLKRGEWAMATFEKECEETGKWVPSDEPPAILYGKFGESIVTLNYDSEETMDNCLQTWIDQNTLYWRRAKVRKITKEEAFALL